MLETVAGPAPILKAEEWKRFEGETVKPQVRLRQCLGSSENSAVFVADSSGNQLVAVKLVRASVLDADAQLARWNAASKLSHPHLIKILECGRCRLRGAELIFVISEYAEENLGQVLPQRALTPGETREMLGPLVDVLAHLHAAGFAHGRVKPANILAVHDVLKLSCDGIVRANEAQLLPASENAYDPPEGPVKATAAGDMWSLGLVLVQALTQHAPVSGGVKSKLMLAESLSSPFREIARECLNPDSAHRCSARDIALKLGRPLTTTMKSEAKSAEAKAVEPRREITTDSSPARSSSALAVGIAMFVLVVITGAVWWFIRKPRSAENAQITPAFQNAQTVNNTAPSTQRPQPAATPPARTTEGSIIHQVDANVSRSALKTVHGTIKVRIRVNVDGSGSVTGATFVVRGSSQYFARKAMEAAKEWKFAPDDHTQRRAWLLTFEFRKSGGTVVPAETKS